ncbi:penicillin-binding protein 2, partial [Acidithiobacillus ferridurans]|nr:penicillin-binding protein 2 [Acidithiobacillus ferridurans]
PTRGWRYGGVVAAPVFRVTMGTALHQMGVQPDVGAEGWNAAAGKAMTAEQERRWAEGAGDAAH